MRNDPCLRIVFIAKISLTFAVLVFGQNRADALELYALQGPPSDQATSPTITGFSSIADFQNNSSSTSVTRTFGQQDSCDFAIVNGAVYYIGGDATSVGNKELWYWPSLTDWQNDTNATTYGSRTSANPMSGMAIYQNELYILEGSMDSGGDKTLMKWSSINSWVSGDTGEEIGTRGTGFGIGFDIDTDGIVYFLATESDESPNTAVTGTLYTWSSITDFINDTNGSNNGGNFTFYSASPNPIAGLAVVPEPSTWVFASLSCAILTIRTRRASRRSHVS
jgi:hypothetical protein